MYPWLEPSPSWNKTSLIHSAKRYVNICKNTQTFGASISIYGSGMVMKARLIKFMELGHLLLFLPVGSYVLHLWSRTFATATNGNAVAVVMVPEGVLVYSQFLF